MIVDRVLGVDLKAVANEGLNAKSETIELLMLSLITNRILTCTLHGCIGQK